MPTINRYTDISEVDKEAKKDLIDRHSPFIYCNKTAKVNEIFEVTVKMGKEYTHPDDFDHFIKNISLFNGNILLAHADFTAGTFGNMKSHATVTFHIRPTNAKLKLTAQAYCTKHGIWESLVTTVDVLQ